MLGTFGAPFTHSKTQLAQNHHHKHKKAEIHKLQDYDLFKSHYTYRSLVFKTKGGLYQNYLFEAKPAMIPAISPAMISDQDVSPGGEGHQHRQQQGQSQGRHFLIQSIKTTGTDTFSQVKAMLKKVKALDPHVI